MMEAKLEAKLENDRLFLYLHGKIDSANAADVEKEFRNALDTYKADKIVIDCDRLQYITSAGLRVLLRLKRNINDLKLVNVHPELYEILDLTGFTEMMTVQRAFRVVSTEGCELIGQGANGNVYRIDRDNVIKVYRNPDALPEIHHERELARTALILGVPTAIPYDVVKIQGGGYGSVFELLNAKSYLKLLKSGEKSLDELAEMSVSLLKLIHSCEVKPGLIPDMRDTALGWAEFLKDYLPEDQSGKLCSLIEKIPKDMHLVHGDYHLKNIMYQNGESLLIDMDTLSHGHPVFELASMYNAYCGFGAADHTAVDDFFGIPYETAAEFWHKSLALYLDTDSEERLRAVEDKAMIIGQARLLRRCIRRRGMNTDSGRAQIEAARKILAETLPRVDTLLF